MRTNQPPIPLAQSSRPMTPECIPPAGGTTPPMGRLGNNETALPLHTIHVRSTGVASNAEQRKHLKLAPDPQAGKAFVVS